jgi:hypothetical protein
MENVPCVMCGDPAVALYRMEKGCVCRPDDREQALCQQHIVKATPLGSMELVRYLAELIVKDPCPTT